MNILNTLINFLITEGLLEDMILPVRNPDTPKLAITCMKVCLPHKMDARITGRVSACFKQVSVLTSGLCGRQLWAWGGGVTSDVSSPGCIDLIIDGEYNRSLVSLLHCEINGCGLC